MTPLPLPSRQGGPRRFVALLARLGPTSTKIGQFLALRPDLLPQEYCDELLTLVDRGHPFEWPQVQKIVTDELGHDPAELFARFEQRPIGVGSLAQVHRAQLEDGTEVAVKVQRPGIDTQVALDVRRLRLLGRVVARSGIKLPVSARDVADELGVWLRREIDFTHELANVRRLRPLVAGSTIQTVPRAYSRLCTRRVLTYDYLEGVKVSAVLEELRAGSSTRSGGQLLVAAERRRFAANLITASLTQMFRYRFFHADLHPGNLLVLPDGKVGFVDFGLCDALDETVRTNQLRYIAAVNDRDQPRMFRALNDILVARAESDVNGLQRDFAAETRSLGDKASAEEDADDGRSTARCLIGVLRAARQNHFDVPHRILSLYRALVTVETLAVELGLRDALREVGSGFFAELQREELLSQMFNRDQLQQVLAGMLTLTRDGPLQLAQFLADAAEGNVRLKVEVSDSARVVSALNRRARLWAAATLSISVAILLTIPGLPVIFGIPLAWSLAAILGGLYLTCIFLWRRL